MTTSIRQAGQFAHVGLNLGQLQNIDVHTGLLGDTHVTSRYEHGVVSMDQADAIIYQRELLAALATHGYRADVSGAVADLGEGA
jgi:hypothetical protein